MLACALRHPDRMTGRSSVRPPTGLRRRREVIERETEPGGCVRAQSACTCAPGRREHVGTRASVELARRAARSRCGSACRPRRRRTRGMSPAGRASAAALARRCARSRARSSVRPRSSRSSPCVRRVEVAAPGLDHGEGVEMMEPDQHRAVAAGRDADDRRGRDGAIVRSRASTKRAPRGRRPSPSCDPAPSRGTRRRLRRARPLAATTIASPPAAATPAEEVRAAVGPRTPAGRAGSRRPGSASSLA